MAKFLTPLTVTEIDDSVFEVADHPFLYESDAAMMVIEVPVGFHTDFASVPRVLPLIYNLLGNVAHEPAVIHDWLYYSGTVTKAVADRVLLEAMGVVGIPAWRRYPIYWGVVLGGAMAWKAYRQAASLK